MKYKFYGCENELVRNSFARPSFFPHQKPVSFSKNFCELFSKHFEGIFIRTTGILPSSKIGLIQPNRYNSPQLYEPGLVSKLNPVLWILPDYHDDISFCWQSKTGKIIKPTDEDFDEEDLECWIEGLKPDEYWKQVATEKKSHPFQIANLPFELKVFGFGVDTVLRIYFTGNKEEIEQVISATIEVYNEKSEALNRKNGVVHNCRIFYEEPILTASVDTGSAGTRIIKQILKSFKKLKGIKKVEVDL